MNTKAEQRVREDTTRGRRGAPVPCEWFRLIQLRYGHKAPGIHTSLPQFRALITNQYFR